MDYTTIPAEKYKPVKCPICKKGAFKGPRSLSMHVHLEHKNLSPKDMQKYIAFGTFGSAKTASWMKQLDISKNPDEHPEIPSAVKKYWKILRHEKTAAARKQAEKEAERQEKTSSAKKGKTFPEPKPLKVMTVGEIKNKLKDVPEEEVIVVWIKDINSWRFIKDAFRNNPDVVSGEKTEDDTDINLSLTKKVDIEKDESGKTIIDKNHKILHAGELDSFLRWDKISDNEIIFINSKGKGGSKLTKIEKINNIFGSECVLFTFEYDKGYYKGVIKKYLQTYHDRR